LEVHDSVATFTSHGELHEFGAEKPISWANKFLAHFDFFTINFTVWTHILSTCGDALTHSKFQCSTLWTVKIGWKIRWERGNRESK
jgi:hypothetical protein